jgi:hypothetical protein
MANATLAAIVWFTTAVFLLSSPFWVFDYLTNALDDLVDIC